MPIDSDIDARMIISVHGTRHRCNYLGGHLEFFDFQNTIVAFIFAVRGRVGGAVVPSGAAVWRFGSSQCTLRLMDHEESRLSAARRAYDERVRALQRRYSPLRWDDTLTSTTHIVFVTQCM